MESEQLTPLLASGPALDQIERIVATTHPQLVAASVALQRDAADAYAGLPPARPLTRERLGQVLGALYLAEVMHIDALTRAGTPGEALRWLMDDLQCIPSAMRAVQETPGRGL